MRMIISIIVYWYFSYKFNILKSICNDIDFLCKVLLGCMFSFLKRFFSYSKNDIIILVFIKKNVKYM